VRVPAEQSAQEGRCGIENLGAYREDYRHEIRHSMRIPCRHDNEQWYDKQWH
jgi:hypothetical protein